MKALTDYPLFPEEYGRAAPVRKVTIINYDGDKYCRVMFNGVQYEIKRGYLWRSSRRVCYKHDTLCRHFDRTPWNYD